MKYDEYTVKADRFGPVAHHFDRIVELGMDGLDAAERGKRSQAEWCLGLIRDHAAAAMAEMEKAPPKPDLPPVKIVTRIGRWLVGS